MDTQEEKLLEDVTRKPKRFSITRILILLFIIMAIPAFLLFPGLNMARECARRAKCLSNLKQIGLALKQSAIDNNETLPFADDGVEPYQAFGKLHPAYASALEIFRCPSSGDTSWNVKVDLVKDREPFSKDFCRRSLSYAYGQNKGKPWTEEAPAKTRIAADKYATYDYATDRFPKNTPLNHSKKSQHNPPGRFVVMLDGSANEDNNLEPLEANPEIDINAGNPDAKHDPEHDQTGTDWWSDPPEKK